MSSQFTKLQTAWDIVKKYGKHVRILKLDGLKAWNKIKPILLSIDTTGQWKSRIYEIYNHMKSTLGIVEKETDIDHNTWEKHHFYLQHARIPNNNRKNPPFYRLLQIAYNAGQLEAIFDDPFYTAKLKKYYYDNKLNKLETYMSNTVLNLFEHSIDDLFLTQLNAIANIGLVGGGYKAKYQKYKGKYLDLKQQLL